MDSQPSTSTSQFDTTQSSSKNDTIGIKSGYMQLLDQADALAGNPNVRQSMVQMNNVIDKADVLFSKVKNTVEMNWDAKIMHSMVTNLEQTTNNLDVGEGKFNLFVLAEQFKMVSLNNEGKPSWEVLAKVAKPVVYNSLPCWSPLMGSFDFSTDVSASQQKRVRHHRQKDTIAEKKEPERLSQVDKSQEGMEAVVQRIFVKLRKYYKNNQQRPISYYRFLVNPTSFSTTVENIFHMSFLVNDGFVKLELADGEEPVISPILQGKENDNSQNMSRTSVRKQNIICIDMQTWKDLVHVLDIKTAML